LPKPNIAVTRGMTLPPQNVSLSELL
jgi:hypothetical protein